VVDEIRKIPSGQRILLAGDALARYGELLRSSLSSNVVFAPQMMWIARPSLVAMIGSALLRKGTAADLDTIEPMYVRLSEAERKAMKPVDDGTVQD
jgi:hypothetical protein